MTEEFNKQLLPLLHCHMRSYAKWPRMWTSNPNVTNNSLLISHYCNSSTFARWWHYAACTISKIKSHTLSWALSWSRFLGSQPTGDIIHKPSGRLPYACMIHIASLWRMGKSACPTLAICGAKFIEFWENVGDPCLFRRYSQLSWKAVNNPSKNGHFLHLQFSGREAPNFGHEFAILTHFRTSGNIWLSCVMWALWIAGKK